MKKTIAGLILLLVATCHSVLVRAQAQPIYRNRSASVEQRAEDLLSRMTLEGKIEMIGAYNDF